jgi:effector-binding domain-containing protein
MRLPGHASGARGRTGVSLALPGGLAASIIHLGPSETLDQTYDQLQRSLDGSGLHAVGPMWAI